MKLARGIEFWPRPSQHPIRQFLRATAISGVRSQPPRGVTPRRFSILIGSQMLAWLPCTRSRGRALRTPISHLPQ